MSTRNKPNSSGRPPQSGKLAQPSKSSQAVDISPNSEVEDGEGDDRVIGQALRASLVVFVLLAAGIGGGIYWYNRAPDATAGPVAEVKPAELRTTLKAQVPSVTFTDITAAAGIDFTHNNGAYGDKLLPETMGGGCAFLDFDNDGDQDLLLVNSDSWPWQKQDDAPRPTSKLYRNNGTGEFADATADSGLGDAFYGMGCAVGDYDNDGWVDLYISGLGAGRLYHNEQGKFVDVTSAAGAESDPEKWGTSCAWFDYDRDGDLDLFIGSYVKWSREIDVSQDFRLVGVGRAYGPPIAFEGSYCTLLRNDDGKFADVSKAAGIQVNDTATQQRPMAKSLGVAVIDLDGDGWLDVIVSNDTVQNFLFHNQKDGTFEEIGALSGMAFDSEGKARGAMGVDSARFRNSDAVGIAIGNFANEMTALYVQQGSPLRFADESIASGLGPQTRQALTFGLFFFDYDLDGRLDLFTANGHLEDQINKVQPSQYYEQPPRLFWNCGADEKTEFGSVAADKCGADFGKPMVGRGAAYADIDGDGDLDVLITATGGKPRLLRNDQQLGHHWLRVKLIGKTVNRDAIGSRVDILAGGATMSRLVTPARSYLSQTELPVTFGLGATDKVDKLTIRWPDGSKQELTDLAVDQLHTISQAADSASAAR